MLVPGVWQRHSTHLRGLGAQIRPAKMSPPRGLQLAALLLPPFTRLCATCRKTPLPDVLGMAGYLRTCSPWAGDIPRLLASDIPARATPSSGGRERPGCGALHAALHPTGCRARCDSARRHPWGCPPRMQLAIHRAEGIERKSNCFAEKKHAILFILNRKSWGGGGIALGHRATDHNTTLDFHCFYDIPAPG